jgi:DNA-binding CsgD family transcriptional regulator
MADPGAQPGHAGAVLGRGILSRVETWWMSGMAPLKSTQPVWVKLRARKPAANDRRRPLDPGADLECFSALERAIWSETAKGASPLEVALKLLLYEDVVRRHLQTISEKLSTSRPLKGGGR